MYNARERQLPHVLLIVIFVFTLIIVVNFYADLHEIEWLFLATYVFEDGSRYLIGPLIFLYIKSLFENTKGFFRKNYAHLLPYLIYLIVISLPVVLGSLFTQVHFDFPHLKILKTTQNLTGLKDIYFLVYAFLSLKLFNTYRARMKSNYSSFSEKDFGWVKQMLRCAIIVIIIDVVVLVFELFFEFFSWDTGYITAMAMIFVIFYLGYYGIKQTKVFLPDFLMNANKETRTRKNKTNQFLNFTDEEIIKLNSKLARILEEDKLYLEEDLTLGRLAEAMDFSEKRLSALINQHMNTTFYDLVNKYRVASVKEKLKSSKYNNYTFLGIANESGFKSKSSFYRIFKRETGVSPAQFKNGVSSTS
ncbi:AraC family transcriptional regulator [Maribacter sp.]|nr:AraC family transcriptional regulator [Maribacter sp.]